MTAIVWFRQDLRLGDNPALSAAIASGRPLVLLYLLDDETPGRWRMGAASRWWLHHALAALARDVARRGGALTLRRGKAETLLPQLAQETGARSVFWNRAYEAYAIARDQALQEKLGEAGVEIVSSNGGLLFEPWTVRTKSGGPYKAFTPFWRACLQMGWRAPLSAPSKLSASAEELASDSLASWRLPPTTPNWAKGFEAEWTPGEGGAREALEAFIEEHLRDYATGRDKLGVSGTSRLSPHLHFGEISPAQVRAAIEGAAACDPTLQGGADKYLTEIGWREFSNNLLYHWPALPEENWRPQFDSFAWRDDESGFVAWQRGETGYPVVDAAMRELWATGYIHNRARMVAASFLIKHLLVDWRRGQDWFWDTLVDADLANNAASWQWVAGSGADAAPYFRIFNPVTQGERYDPDGAYVRKWVPELARLSDAVIHKPWTASRADLHAADVALGQAYRKPIVDHDQARKRALAAFAALSKR